MIKNDIIDYDESIKREYESDYFNDKFFKIFPTKYEKMLREYEVIYFKDEVRISFFNLDFSDDLIWYEECDFIDRVRHSLYSISELINSQKTEKLKKFWNIFEEIYWEIVQEKIPKDNKKVLNFMNELKMEINEILKTFPLEKVEEYREIIKEYAGKFWNRIEKSKTKSKRLYYEKALLFILVKLENLLNIQHEEQFLQNYVCILNDLYSDDFNDNGSFSNLFFLFLSGWPQPHSVPKACSHYPNCLCFCKRLLLPYQGLQDWTLLLKARRIQKTASSAGNPR